MQEENNKKQTANIKQDPNNNKQFDLEDRTLRYAKNVSGYFNSLPKSLANLENGKQLIRAAGSVGANYIEANEALGKQDFKMRLRVARKEAKESRYWLYLTAPAPSSEADRSRLINEATELIKILSAIILKLNTFKY
jgi:four helix bundle protein